LLCTANQPGSGNTKNAVAEIEFMEISSVGTFDFSKVSYNGDNIDFRLTDDTPLKFDIDYWDKTNEEAEIYIRIPLIDGGSGSVPTEFKMYYGNSAGIYNSQQKDLTWYNRYQAVYHCSEITDDSGDLRDALGNNHGTKLSPSTIFREAGLLGYSQRNTTTGNYISASDSDDFYFDGDFSIEWKMEWIGSISNGSIMGQSNGGGFQDKWFINYGNMSAGNLSFDIVSGGSESTVHFSWSPSADTEYHCVITREGNDFKFYVNGSQVGGTQVIAKTMPNVASDFRLFNEGEGWQYFQGRLDEVRITKGTAYSSNFIASQYQTDTDNILTLSSGESATITDTITLSELVETVENSTVIDSNETISI